MLEQAVASAPGSRWAAMTAFKGAEFDANGRNITAVYGVRRIPRNADYVPKGQAVGGGELARWYSWSPTED